MTIDYDGPQADPRWQAELSKIAPAGGRLSWFLLGWESGDVWDRVSRWIVYQMIPAGRIPPFIREWLEGPNPRTMGHFDKVRNVFVSKAPPISRRQWLLFRETGCYARPYWVIQGSKGGHKYQFDKIESRVSVLNGGPKQPPRPGELPYTEPSQRTFDQLARSDRLRKYKMAVDFLESSEERIKAEERNALVNMKAQVWDWITSQMEEPADRMTHHLKRIQTDAPPAPGIDRKLERLEEEFITSEV